MQTIEFNYYQWKVFMYKFYMYKVFEKSLMWDVFIAIFIVVPNQENYVVIVKRSNVEVTQN